ncbi:MAG: penicillin-binding protein 1C [Ignavibacteriaceae bacterium]
MKSYSKVIYSKEGTLLTAYLSDDDKWRMKTSIDEVSPELKKAIIEKEDKWFYWHPGINPVSIVRALFQNITSGERISGASTITMQAARLLEPKERNYFNKILELFRAVQLEIYYSKEEILGIYLSHLPYGGNIEGVKSAAYLYFNTHPSKLSLAQAITLAVIPNNPNKLRIDRGAEHVVTARNKLLKKFISSKIFLAEDIKDALTEPLKPNRFEIPFIAPHFCNFLNKNFPGDEIKTYLSLPLQVKLENLLWNHVQRVYGKGVTNGAVIVIDNKTNAVAGYCGSSDFYNVQASGQVDGVRSIRSPGSALKPFLYAEAFNSGNFTPKMKLLDIPTDFGGYNPENFDLKFNGDVTVEYALLNSLNIPAVRLLRDVGIKEFESLLIGGGMTRIEKDKNKLGLSIILGGCGVTLEQLTKLYTAFPGKGVLYDLKYVQSENDPDMRSKNLFSEASAYMISEILSQNIRPDLPIEYIHSSKLPLIAWKTGTSYGKRDAWAIGYSPNYTVGVWMGNFDGKGSPHIIGAETAVPLLLDIFNTIDYNNTNKWFNKPEKLHERKVCSSTGLLPGKYCTNFTSDYCIDKVSHDKVCTLKQQVYTNHNCSVEYCPGCLPTEGIRKEIYPVYDPELEMWYRENGISFKKRPEHNPDCNTRLTSTGPVITSPSENYEYLIEENTESQIMLRAASIEGARIHYWYINDRFYKKVKADENVFFKPQKGKNKITCLDDMGRDESIFINVKYY